VSHPSLAAALAQAEDLLRQFREDSATTDALDRIVDLVAGAFRSGGKLMTCGNGGSMADAMHVAEEFTGRFRRDRRPYPAIALGDVTHLTCVGNDFGFDQVFSRLVEAYGKPGDVLLLLSTSGNSNNLVLAAEAARAGGVIVVGALGRGGGRLAPLCDVILHAPGEGSDRIQELHMLAMHAVIEAVEFALGH